MSASQATRPRTLFFASPRCQEDDEQLLLPTGSLQQHDERWKHMSELAGAHQQDDSVLILTHHRNMSPRALKLGVPPQVAARVRELHLPVLHTTSAFNTNNSNLLPEWLDVVSSLFFQLQHLTVTLDEGHLSSSSLSSEGARMRRLYVLYRLPDLLSIDGKPVTPLERELARPSSPSGYRVNRDEWVTTAAAAASSSILNNAESSSSSEDEDDDSDSSCCTEEEDEIRQHGDAVEVSLYGVVKFVDAELPKEEWQVPRQDNSNPRPLERHSSLASHTESVEGAMRALHLTCGTLLDEDDSDGEKETPDETLVVSDGTTARHSMSSETEVQCFRAQPLSSPCPLPYNKPTESPTSDHAATSDCDAIQSQSPEELSRSSCSNSSISTTSLSPQVSPSGFLSSPFPLQYRSKSFNGEQSSSPANKENRGAHRLSLPGNKFPAKTTIDDVSSPTESLEKAKRKRLSLSKAERPPACPGPRRSITPTAAAAKKPKRRLGSRWRTRIKLRVTSIVDKEDEDDDDDSGSSSGSSTVEEEEQVVEEPQR